MMGANVQLVIPCIKQCNFNAELFLTLSDKKIEAQQILVTDVGQSTGDALICWHYSKEILTTVSTGWHHKFIASKNSHKVTREKGYLGWRSELEQMSPYNILKLLRKADTTAAEGIFICNVRDTSVSVGIHYPSELKFEMACNILKYTFEINNKAHYQCLFVYITCFVCYLLACRLVYNYVEGKDCN